MAWLEQRSGRFRIKFRFGGRNFQVSIGTGNKREAEAGRVRLEENLRLVERGRLDVPSDADLGLFLISDGKRSQPLQLTQSISLGELFDVYERQITPGSKEVSTRSSEQLHMKHLGRLIGRSTSVARVTTETIQDYVNCRAKEVYRGKSITSRTTKKEVATLQTVWNWARRRNHVPGLCPIVGLTYPKGREKPPFRTYDQIQAMIGRSPLSKTELREIWDGLFLDKNQVAEVLEYVRAKSTSPWLYPFFTAAAHTGARRGELLRAQVDDFDFENRVFLIREKKKSKTRETFRTVDMTPLLESVMRDYFEKDHPGGRFAFAVLANNPIHRSTSTDAFRAVLKNGKWSVLRGYHAFRHSFASNLAAAGIDEHVIAALMGHLTSEMRARYRHLFPSQRRAAVASVFG